MNSNTKFTIGVVLVLAVITGIIYAIMTFQENKEVTYNTAEINKVENFGEILSLQKIANNFYNTTDVTTIKKLLDSNSTFNTKYNTSDYVFIPKSAEYIKIKNNYIYKLIGKIILNGFSSDETVERAFHFNIFVDTTNRTYAVNNSKYSLETMANQIQKITIPKNDVNTFSLNNSYTTYDECSYYFYDFNRDLMNDINDAYKLLVESQKKEYNTIDKFSEYLNKSTLTGSMEKCRLHKEGVYVVGDTQNNIYTIYVTGPLEYQVKIN